MINTSDDAPEAKPVAWVEIILSIFLAIGMPVFLLTLLFGGVHGCLYMNDVEMPDREESARIEFTKVVMHEPGKYTVFALSGKTYVEYTFSRATLVKDVHPGEPMYVEYTKGIRKTIKTHKEVDGGQVWGKPIYIHIHDISEIGGAGWDHGKFGSGQTTVIE